MVDAVSLADHATKGTDGMTADVLVVGGGLAGAAAAIGLTRAGRDVVLLERETGPHDKVCGEFLSHEANRYLTDLGLDPRGLGSVSIDRVRLAHKGTTRTAKLPFAAQSLSRRVLDAALLQAAEDSGADVRRGARATSLDRDGEDWAATVEGGERVAAREVFLATGKHDLRGWKRPPGPQPDLIGFKMYWRLSPEQMRELGATVELALFPGGYAGLQPVEGGRANLSLLVRKSTFATLGQSWPDLLGHIAAGCAHLRARLEGAEPCSERPLAIASIPYGYVANTSDGLWRLGDQAAVIPSFSGDGMSIALHSARLAVEAVLSGQSAGNFQRQMRRDVRRQIGMATMISKSLVTGLGQRAAFGVSAMIPRLMTDVATATRISPRALRRLTLSNLDTAPQTGRTS